MLVAYCTIHVTSMLINDISTVRKFTFCKVRISETIWCHILSQNAFSLFGEDTRKYTLIIVQFNDMFAYTISSS